jgi:amino acid permease
VKGFICTGIVYLPQEFYYGGYGFSIIALLISFFFTTICSFKLLEVRKKVGTN